MIAHIYWVKRYCLRNGNKCGRFLFFNELKFGMQIHQKNMKFDLGYDRGFFNRIFFLPSERSQFLHFLFIFFAEVSKGKGHKCVTNVFGFVQFCIYCVRIFSPLYKFWTIHRRTIGPLQIEKMTLTIEVKAQGQTVFLR